MSIKQMVIESLNDLRKVMKLTPEAEKLLEENCLSKKEMEEIDFLVSILRNDEKEGMNSRIKKIKNYYN